MERSTRQRAAIESAFRQAARPLSPQEVLAAAQAEVPALGIATVYRQIKSMLDAHVIQVVSLPGENDRYELFGQHHHHHFQCQRCDRVFDIHTCPGNFADLAPPGFSVERHELTLYGLCDNCAPRKRAAAQPKARAHAGEDGRTSR